MRTFTTGTHRQKNRNANKQPQKNQFKTDGDYNKAMVEWNKK